MHYDIAVTPTSETTISAHAFTMVRFGEIDIEEQLLSGRPLEISVFYAHASIDTIVGV